jgi:ribosomal protein S18 acetylase RimI-like enzyme
MDYSIISNELANLVIRNASKDDLPALEWEGEYSHFKNLFLNLYRSSLQGDTLLWLAELPGVGLIGQLFVQLLSSRIEVADGISRAYLFSFRVKSAFRNRGVGAKILSFTENDLRVKGFRWSVLNVDQKNIIARKFYEKYGYTVVAPERGIWTYVDQYGKLKEVDEPAWRMEKRLFDPVSISY